MASTSIPVASLGANPEVAKQIKELLLPEYDLVHMCLSLESASTEFTEILSGNLEVAPSSGIGSNVDKPTTERRVPRAIVLGGGVSDEDYVALKEALVKGGLKVEGDGEDVVKFVRVLRDDILALGASRPDPTVISQVIRKKLGQLGL
ncbi:uncharacterized protein CTHT_0000280 [Thermochaetoides thermophila DSM 1495]|uniref:Uncharacterized protein n=1 Tax=Chaetomium thermophilum (strain DSM 1495 / CBS 144.50 / IMI 039719) TaxID=759272 RepID=G0RXT1_CHATD|nr:hypothetical protein CTHT_0000280 [Thermochaetoides thermophila DSM 1495]EGS24097.1 hypothetical protein CTHT_0000280 [Thermochaetoides thermophila DSM 1495]